MYSTKVNMSHFSDLGRTHLNEMALFTNRLSKNAYQDPALISIGLGTLNPFGGSVSSLSAASLKAELRVGVKMHRAPCPSLPTSIQEETYNVPQEMQHH